MSPLDIKVPTSLDAALRKSAELFHGGQLQSALELSQIIAERYPEDAQSLYTQGLIYEKWEQGDNAMLCLEQALERRPDFSDAALSLALLRYDVGNLPGAAAAIRQGLAAQPIENTAERLLLLKEMVEQDALQSLLIHAAQVEAGYVRAVALKTIARAISTLLAESIDSCHTDPAEVDTFFLRGPQTAYRAVLDAGADLIITNHRDEEVYRKTIVSQNEGPQSGIYELPDDRAHVTYPFQAGPVGVRHFLAYVHTLCNFLGTLPDRLYLVSRPNEGEPWDPPTYFDHRAWRDISAALADATAPWRIDFFLKTKDIYIEGHAGNDDPPSIALTADHHRLEPLEKLYLDVEEA